MSDKVNDFIDNNIIGIMLSLVIVVYLINIIGLVLKLTEPSAPVCTKEQYEQVLSFIEQTTVDSNSDSRFIRQKNLGIELYCVQYLDNADDINI